MVLIANKKTSAQMKEDLSLFVGDNVDQFVEWLHYCLDEIKVGNDPFVKPPEEPVVSKATPTKEAPVKESAQDTTSTSKTISQSSSRSDSAASSQHFRTTTVTPNDESKENSKQKPARRLITFSNEDRGETRKVEQSASPPAVKEQPTKNVHKRIVFNAEDDRNDQPAKKFKNEITLNASRSESLSRSEPPRTEPPPPRTEPPSRTTRSEPIRSLMTTRSTSQAESAKSVPSSVIRTGVAARGPEPQSNLKSQLASSLQPNQYRKSYVNQVSNRSPGQHPPPSQQHLNPPHTNRQHLNPQHSSSHGDSEPHADHPHGRAQNGSDNQKYNQQVPPSIGQRIQPSSETVKPPQRTNIRDRLAGKVSEKEAEKMTEKVIEKVSPKREQPAKPKRQRPLFFQAIAEANQSSSMTSVSIRNHDPDKPKVTMVERLGHGSAKAVREKSPAQADEEEPVMACDDEDLRKKKRLIKFNQRGAQQAAQQIAQQTVQKAAQQAAQQANQKVGQPSTQHSVQPPLNKDDLRNKLQNRKRKFNGDQSTEASQPAKRSPTHNPIRPVAEESKEQSDDELRALKEKIRPKSQVLAENRQAKEENSQKESVDDVNIIIKQELIKKMNAIEAKMAEHKNRIKQSGKELLSTKKERCRYWPVCMNQDKCQYHHPTEICGLVF